MRTFCQFYLRLKWDGRGRICCIVIRLNINFQNGIRHLVGDQLNISIIPYFELLPVRRQRISDSAESWFGLPKPDLPCDRYLARLIILTPVCGRRIAVSGNPAPVNENSRRSLP